MRAIFIFLALVLPLLADEWVVEFSTEAPLELPQQFAEEHGLQYTKTILMDRFHLFTNEQPALKRQVTDGQLSSLGCLLSRNQDCQHISNPFGVKWIKKQKHIVLEKRWKKPDLPYKDPLLSTQWHLHNITNMPGHVHINVVPVWKMGITGKGVVIAVIDDGIQHDHPDLAPNFKSGDNNWNFNGGKNYKPCNMDEDWHGTAVAGLALASPDGKECGVGVAPNAKFSSIVLLQQHSAKCPTTPKILSDAIIAQAVSHYTQTNHIFCNSWGPKDDGLRKEGPEEITAEAIKQAIEKGRNGKGSIYMWAAGNGRAELDNCNYDGYTNSRYVTTIGGITSTGTWTESSEPCCAQIGVLPSGFGMSALQTTDLRSTDGQNKLLGSLGNCNTEFAGTSAATPILAGIAALVLEVNPNVTWLDLQYILKFSAIKTDANHSGWFLNGGGNWVSHEYGFGVIDAYGAVEAAKRFKNYSIKEVSISGENKQRTPLFKNGRNGVIQSEIYLNSSIQIHHIEVFVTIEHSFRGHLSIQLISPFGTHSVFAEKHKDSNPNYSNWRFVTLFSWGESSKGTWILLIKEEEKDFPDLESELVEWSMNVYGIDENSTYPDLVKRGGEFEWKIPVASPYFLNGTVDQETRDWVKIGLMGSFIGGIFMVVSIVVVLAIKKTVFDSSQLEMEIQSLEESDMSEQEFVNDVNEESVGVHLSEPD